MDNNKEYINQRKPFFNFVKRILRFFYKKPQIINLNDKELEDRAIYISNHGINGLGGLCCHELYFPKKFRPLGQYEMCANFKERWFYLYHIHYRLRQGEIRIVSLLKASFVALISKSLYKGSQLIPTYSDARSFSTVKSCIKVFQDNSSIMLYPENLNDFYNNIFREFYSGFVTIASIYHKKTGIDLPIYPVYYSHQLNTVVIDKPYYAVSMLSGGKSRDSVAEFFKNKTNDLFINYIEPKIKEKLAILGEKISQYDKKKRFF